MAGISTNIHRTPDPKDAARKFLDAQLKTRQRVFWDKQAYGMRLCSGKDWESEAVRHLERYYELKNDDDVEEMFMHYEDGE